MPSPWEPCRKPPAAQKKGTQKGRKTRLVPTLLFCKLCSAWLRRHTCGRLDMGDAVGCYTSPYCLLQPCSEANPHGCHPPNGSHCCCWPADCTALFVSNLLNGTIESIAGRFASPLGEQHRS